MSRWRLRSAVVPCVRCTPWRLGALGFAGMVVVLVGLGAVAIAPASAALAQKWLSLLDEGVRARGLLPFEDGPRRDWSYLPRDAPGVRIGDMSAEARAAALALLDDGLGDQGRADARAIMEREVVLGAIEEAAGQPGARRARDPDRYRLAIFGDPGAGRPWSWRFEGHHLSVTATQLPDGQRVVAPLFLGANPAEVREGPHAAPRLLGPEEELARALLLSLPAERSGRAIVSPQAPTDILTRADPVVRPLPEDGLAVAEMAGDERASLRRLIDVYLDRLPADQARMQRSRIEAAGFDRVRFAWAGGIGPGDPHYYRIHGPTFLIEYDNTQNNANHVHTVWRDLQNDFGGDLLRDHYERHRDAPEPDGHGSDGSHRPR